MGFLDRLRSMTRRLRQPQEPEEVLPGLTLHLDDEDQWVVQMLASSGLDDAFKEFLAEVAGAKAQALNAARSLGPHLEQVPERARPVSAAHAHELTQQVDKLLDEITFSDLFTYDEDQVRVREKIDTFRAQTGKNVSALKEFMSEQVLELQQALKDIDDAMVGFLQLLEEKHFDQIERVRDGVENLKQIDERKEKYRKYLGTITEQLQKNKQKQERFKNKMREQRELIRNPKALQALDDLTRLEERLDSLVHQHEEAASDALSYYKKHPELSIPREAHEVLQDLSKYGSSYLAGNPEKITKAFESVADHLEQEGRGNLGNLVDRLRAVSQSARQDAAVAEGILPQQRNLKQEIMRDIAAINIYDQQQFLLRAVREERELQAKQRFVQERLKDSDRVAIDREIRDAAIAFGAAVSGDSLEEVVPHDKAETLEEVTEEVEHEVSSSEETVESAEEILSHPEKIDEEAAERAREKRAEEREEEALRQGRGSERVLAHSERRNKPSASENGNGGDTQQGGTIGGTSTSESANSEGSVSKGEEQEDMGQELLSEKREADKKIEHGSLGESSNAPEGGEPESR